MELTNPKHESYHTNKARNDHDIEMQKRMDNSPHKAFREEVARRSEKARLVLLNKIALEKAEKEYVNK